MSREAIDGAKIRSIKLVNFNLNEDDGCNASKSEDFYLLMSAKSNIYQKL